MTQDQTTQSGTEIFKTIKDESDVSNYDHPDLDFILDIPVNLTVELGQTRIAIKNLLELSPGSVIELDGQAGSSLNILINGCLIAEGEVVIINEKYGIRITDIKSPTERLQKIKR